MSDHNTVIYHSSTFKQCLQLLTFPHSSSCNANSAIQQMSEKRTDSGCLSCSWLSKSADGTTKQTIFSSAVSSVHVQCVSEMFTKASVCLRDLSGGPDTIPLASSRTSHNKGASVHSHREPTFRTLAWSGEKKKKTLLNFTAYYEAIVMASSLTSEIHHVSIFPSVIGMMTVILPKFLSEKPHKILTYCSPKELERPSRNLSCGCLSLGHLMVKSLMWLFITRAFNG